MGIIGVFLVCFFVPLLWVGWCTLCEIIGDLSDG